MRTTTSILAATAAFIVLATVAVACGAAQQAPEVLKTGAYTAKVKAITCGGCGPLIVRTMEAMKEIDTVSVDSQNKTVRFAVKEGAALDRAEMQKALDAAAKKMGMGANYTFLDLKPVK
jgi:hypothetical protein